MKCSSNEWAILHTSPNTKQERYVALSGKHYYQTATLNPRCCWWMKSRAEKHIANSAKYLKLEAKDMQLVQIQITIAPR